MSCLLINIFAHTCKIQFYQAVCQFVTLLLGAEFTRAHFSNVASLISELPQRCICLLQEQDVGKASKVFTSTLPMEFQRCSVTSDRDMESLQATLPQLIARDVCVLVEHLHHCDGWTEKLKELLKVRVEGVWPLFACQNYSYARWCLRGVALLFFTGVQFSWWGD